jgi:hypothetical protein
LESDAPDNWAIFNHVSDGTPFIRLLNLMKILNVGVPALWISQAAAVTCTGMIHLLPSDLFL